jgi:hypothetical protein
VRLFNEDFIEYTWDAIGFKMQLSGFNYKLVVLLKQTVDKVDPLRFEMVKEEEFY